MLGNKLFTYNICYSVLVWHFIASVVANNLQKLDRFKLKSGTDFFLQIIQKVLMESSERLNLQYTLWYQGMLGRVIQSMRIYQASWHAFPFFLSFIVSEKLYKQAGLSRVTLKISYWTSYEFPL